jgi:hypothetical protein
MIRPFAVAAFVISLLLAVDVMDPTTGWLVTVTVLSGLATLRARHIWSVWRGDPAAVWQGELDFLLGAAAFIIALLLSTGALDTADNGWLVALTALTGILAFLPPRGRLWGRRWWDARRW